MRIELKYQSPSPSSDKILRQLEEIIADERLPLAVELTETEISESPIVRIHASQANSQLGGSADLSCDEKASSEQQFLEKLRKAVLESWHQHAISPLEHHR